MALVGLYFDTMSFSKPPPLSGLAVLAMANVGDGFPFASVVAELHRFLNRRNIVYAVVGGVAVARAGTFRTTGDIDILVRRKEWKQLDNQEGEAFRIGPDWAEHRESAVPVDVLFAGDNWDLPFLLPDPEEVREWDQRGGAWFMAPHRLLELKAAVYRSKREEYGPATAAKDLSDVTMLLQCRPELRDAGILKSLDPSVHETVRQASAEVNRYRQKRQGRA